MSGKNDLTNTSFIAQELMEIYPSAVSGKEVDFNEKNSKREIYVSIYLQ